MQRKGFNVLVTWLATLCLEQTRSCQRNMIRLHAKVLGEETEELYGPGGTKSIEHLNSIDLSSLRLNYGREDVQEAWNDQASPFWA